MEEIWVWKQKFSMEINLNDWERLHKDRSLKEIATELNVLKTYCIWGNEIWSKFKWILPSDRVTGIEGVTPKNWNWQLWTLYSRWGLHKVDQVELSPADHTPSKGLGSTSNIWSIKVHLQF